MNVSRFLNSRNLSKGCVVRWQYFWSCRSLIGVTKCLKMPYKKLPFLGKNSFDPDCTNTWFLLCILYAQTLMLNCLLVSFLIFPKSCRPPSWSCFKLLAFACLNSSRSSRWLIPNVVLENTDLSSRFQASFSYCPLDILGVFGSGQWFN